MNEEQKKIVLEERKKAQEEVSKGLGDTIKKATDFFGIPQCGGCKKRQEMLNKKFPYKK
jgi:hypothetical protein